MTAMEPANKKHFCNLVYWHIRQKNSTWTAKDVSAWLGCAIGDVKFGDPSHDWTAQAAKDLADTFIEEATTW